MSKLSRFTGQGSSRALRAAGAACLLAACVAAGCGTADPVAPARKPAHKTSSHAATGSTTHGAGGASGSTGTGGAPTGAGAAAATTTSTTGGPTTTGPTTGTTTTTGATTTTSSGTGLVSTNVQIIVEPGDATALISAIQGAQSSVHMTMYLLTDGNLITALTDQAAAGHEVKVVLDQSSQTQSQNQGAYDQLKAAGAGVAWGSNQFTYTHEKCVIIDHAAAWIMTMNGTHSAPFNNREFLAVASDPADVQEAETIFAADFAQTAAQVSGHLLVAPVNAHQAILDLIKSAASTIDLEGEELSDVAIATALGAAQDHGIKVTVTLPSGALYPTEQTAVDQLKQHSVPVVQTSTPIIHAKAIVVDGARAYVGSENFTTGSLEFNRELGLILAIASEVAKIETAIQSDFAAGNPI